MEPIELFARNRAPLTDRLKQINYEGACLIAAHQYVVAQGLEGMWIPMESRQDERGEFVTLGDTLIKHELGINQ